MPACLTYNATVLAHIESRARERSLRPIEKVACVKERADRKPPNISGGLRLPTPRRQFPAGMPSLACARLLPTQSIGRMACLRLPPNNRKSGESARVSTHSWRCSGRHIAVPHVIEGVAGKSCASDSRTSGFRSRAFVDRLIGRHEASRTHRRQKKGSFLSDCETTSSVCRIGWRASFTPGTSSGTI